MFANVLHESLHREAPHCAVNYTHCALCGGEMLVDSCSKICDRQQCRGIRVFLAGQDESFRLAFWAQYGIVFPQEQESNSMRSLFDLVQLMSFAQPEHVLESAA